MSIWAILMIFTIYFLIVLAVARMRAELGPPTHDLYDAGPERIMVSALGTRRLGPKNLTMFSLLYWLGYDYRSHPMGHQLEGFKLGGIGGITHECEPATAIRDVGVLSTVAAVELLDRFFTFRLRGHFDKSKTLGLSSIPVVDNACRTHFAELLKRKPGYTCAIARDDFFFARNDELIERAVDGLRKAGLPE